MAAAFHDSRRQDDWLDVGHGQRAADYYRSYCENGEVTYDDRTYYIMAYHDRDDELVLRIMREKFPDDSNAVLLYQIFKDADALDRFRLGPDALDIKYLRTNEAKNTVQKIKEFQGEILFTQDTHLEDYLETQEGKILPIRHVEYLYLTLYVI